MKNTTRNSLWCLLTLLFLFPLFALSDHQEKSGGAPASKCEGSEDNRTCYLDLGATASFTVVSQNYNSNSNCGKKVTILIDSGCEFVGKSGTGISDGEHGLLGCPKAELSNIAVKKNSSECNITLTSKKDGFGTKTWTEKWLSPLSQTIEITKELPDELVYGDEFTVSATSSSGLPVTITASDGSCTGGGENSAEIEVIKGTGECKVSFSQGGNYKYKAAETVVLTKETKKAELNLKVTSPTENDFEISPANTVTAMAELEPSVASVEISTTGQGCGIVTAENHLVIEAAGLGECIINYQSKANAENYDVSNDNQQKRFTFVASPQVIDITQPAPAEAYALDEFTVKAVADSGEPVSIEVMGEGCEPAQSDNGELTITTKEAGLECLIRYTRDEAPPEYDAAEPREQRVITKKQAQAISVDQPGFAEPNSVVEVTAELLHGKSQGGANITLSTNTGCEVTHKENDAEGGITAEIQMAASGVCYVYYETAETAKYEAASAQAKTKVVQKNNDADVSGIWSAAVLAHAKDDAGKAQPITAAPMVSRTRNIAGSYPNTVVMFGTGQYMYEEDLNDQSMQSLYVVHDRGTKNIQRDSKVSDAEGSEFDMLEKREFSYHLLNNEVHRKIKGDRDNKENDLGETYHAEGVNWNTQYGWYVNLDGANLTAGEGAERSVFRPIVVGDILMLTTLIPQVEMSCASESKGVFISMDWTTGFAPQSPSYDVDGDGVLSSADRGFVGSLSSSLSQMSYFNENALFTKDNEIIINKVDPSSSSSGSGYRVGWEEKQAHGIISQ